MGAGCGKPAHAPADEYKAEPCVKAVKPPAVEAGGSTLRSTCSSWYVGANIPGRPRVFMPYIGGFPVYVDRCNQSMDAGYAGFVFDQGALESSTPAIRLTERWHVPVDVEVISLAAIAANRVPVV